MAEFKSTKELIKSLVIPALREHIKVTDTDAIEEIKAESMRIQMLNKEIAQKAKADNVEPKFKKEKFDTATYKSAFLNQIDFAGIKSLCQEMSHEQLQILYNQFLEEEERNGTRKTKIFLTKRLTKEILVNISDYFRGLEVDEKNIWGNYLEVATKLNADEFSASAVEIVRARGIELFLYDLPMRVLKEYLVLNKFNLDDFPLNNPNFLVETILTGQTPAPKPKKEVAKIKFLKTKPSLTKKGLGFHDVFQHFNLTELVEFCKEKELRYSGFKKTQIVKNIIHFLDTGVKPQDLKKSKVDEAEEEEVEEEEEEEEVEEEEERNNFSLEESEEVEVKVSTPSSKKGTPNSTPLLAKSPSKKGRN